jgi:hypothetical protein
MSSSSLICPSHHLAHFFEESFEIGSDIARGPVCTIINKRSI